MNNKLYIYQNTDGSYDAIKGYKLLHYNWSFQTLLISNVKLIPIGPSYTPSGRLIPRPHRQMIFQVQRTFSASNESIKTFEQFTNFLNEGKKEIQNEFTEKEVSLTDILNVNSDGQTLEDAIEDVKRGAVSRTQGKVLLYKKGKKYEIGDGFHRIAEAILKGDKTIMADIITDKINSFINEGIRDKMIPKSDKEIDRALDNMSYPQVAARLLYASQEGDIRVAKILLDKGMSPNCQTELGTTPLMFAVMRGHYDLVELLLQRGARTDIKNKAGKTVFDIVNSTPEDFRGYNITDEQKIKFRLYGKKVHDLLISYSKK